MPTMSCLLRIAITVIAVLLHILSFILNSLRSLAGALRKILSTTPNRCFHLRLSACLVVTT
ncbi:unnamed protein product [Brassica oleracea]|uniref:(rape) hypothetical protein n=1 Tax=Brassica napus TaxID=3708 RepID=A0A816KCA4_BRANA|nr:unnamed protein product [Brassica napus]